MNEYKDKLNNFASRLKAENTSITIQEVRPMKEKTSLKEDETQLNVWIPKSLMKQLKKYSIDHDLTIKDSVVQSIIKLI